MILPEIIAAVFETLAEEGASVALWACANACRQFRDLAQAQLFRIVNIPPNEKGIRRAAGLVDILSSNPGLARRIRELSLTLHPSDPERDKVVLMALNLMETSTIGSIFIHLDPIHSSAYSTLRWTAIHEPLRAALERIIFSPSLHTLRLRWSHFPLHYIVSRLRNVKSLALENVVGSELEDDSTSYNNGDSSREFDPKHVTEALRLRELRLTSLPLRLFKRFFTARHISGVPLVDWTAMKSLSIELQDAHDQNDVISIVSDVLAQTPVLTTFCIWDVRAPLDGLFTKLHSQAYDTLRLVDVSIVLNSIDGDPYLGLLDTLAKFPSRNNLESLTLRIDIHFIPGEWDVDEGRWGKIEQVLVQSAFPCLKAVEMDIYVIDWDEYYEGEGLFRDLFDLSFESLESQLEFKFDVTHEMKW